MPRLHKAWNILYASDKIPAKICDEITSWLLPQMCTRSQQRSQYWYIHGKHIYKTGTWSRGSTSPAKSQRQMVQWALGFTLCGELITYINELSKHKEVVKTRIAADSKDVERICSSLSLVIDTLNFNSQPGCCLLVEAIISILEEKLFPLMWIVVIQLKIGPKCSKHLTSKGLHHCTIRFKKWQSKWKAKRSTML